MYELYINHQTLTCFTLIITSICSYKIFIKKYNNYVYFCVFERKSCIQPVINSVLLYFRILCDNFFDSNANFSVIFSYVPNQLQKI